MRRGTRTTGAVIAMALAAGASTAVGASSAHAIDCTGQTRYSASTNTVYLLSGTATLAEIAGCRSGQIVKDTTGKVWQLNADLVVQNGATLRLRGPAVGGEVDTLRLRSPASAARTEVSSITAQYGTIEIDSVKITSWDQAAGGPDTNAVLPAGAASDARGRAFIRAVSFMEGGTPRESTMTIVNSDLGYLGYDAAESYGVSYKGRGCDAANPGVCAALNVYGAQRGSRFHHNFFGTYLYNARNMQIAGNDYGNNIAYGLDLYGDSSYLTVTGNHTHHNGKHGIICSQRCDHLTIANNESDHNGIPPYQRPGDEDAAEDEIHGIMLHRGITDTVIENNTVHDQPNGAGIAVFDSSRITVRNNRVSGSKVGLRYSGGATDVTSTGNVIRGSAQHAVFTYKGTDPPSSTTTGGRPTRLTFTGNTFDGSASNIVKLTDSDVASFSGNTVTGAVGPVMVRHSTGTRFTGGTVPASLLFSLGGAGGVATEVAFAGMTAPTVVNLESNSTAVFTNTDRTVYELAAAPALPTAVTPQGGTLRLTYAQAGNSNITVTPRPVRVTPASGSATARLSGWGTSTMRVHAAGQAGVRLSFTVGGLVRGRLYTVTANGARLATVMADSSGTITFTATPAGTAAMDYVIAARQFAATPIMRGRTVGVSPALSSRPGALPRSP